MERPVERRAFLGVLPGLLALAARPARGQDAPPGVWCGAVTARGATVKVLADRAGVPVELELTDGASPPFRRAQPTDAHGVATFVLDGLRERTRYRYAVTTPGRPALDGRLRTFGERPFSAPTTRTAPRPAAPPRSRRTGGSSPTTLSPPARTRPSTSRSGSAASCS